jgi:hypothetical protein
MGGSLAESVDAHTPARVDPGLNIVSDGARKGKIDDLRRR